MRIATPALETWRWQYLAASRKARLRAFAPSWSEGVCAVNEPGKVNRLAGFNAARVGEQLRTMACSSAWTSMGHVIAFSSRGFRLAVGSSGLLP